MCIRDRTNAETKMDSCFKIDIFNKIICKFFRMFTESGPSYETTNELRDSYVLRSNDV